MKHVAAYMLCVLGGNASPSADDVKAILKSVGATADEKCLAKVIDELKGKKLETLIAEGQAKFAKVGGGGGGGGGGDAAPAAAAAAAAPAGGKAAAPAAKKAPEPEPEEDMGFSLFD